MTITQLQYLLAVAKYKNFTTAAEQSFVTQPTLSMQIQKLEEELGAELLDRTSHPIMPTPIGEKIIAQAKMVMNEMYKLQHILEEEKGSLEGLFNLGIAPTTAPLLPLFIEKFLKKYPQTTLKIKETSTEYMIRELSEGTLDFGIAPTPLNAPTILNKPLYHEPLMAFIPRQHPLYKQKLITSANLNIKDLLNSKEGCNLQTDKTLKARSEKTTSALDRIIFESGNLETLLELSKSGFGITLLPLLHTRNLSEDDKKCLKPFEKPMLRREISLIYHKCQLNTTFINAVQETIRKLFDKKNGEKDIGITF